MTETERATCPADFDWPAPEVVNCPFPFFEALRGEAPVFEVNGEYLVSRADDITYIALHPELFSNDIFFGDPDPSLWRRTNMIGSIAFSDPPDHKRKRRLALRLVARDRMRASEPLVRGVVDELIDEWIDDGECEFRSQFSDFVPVNVITTILGLPREHVPDFRRWAAGAPPNERTAILALSEEQLARHDLLRKEERDYLRAALVERYEQPRDDFLSEFVHAQVEQDGELDLEYLIDESSILLFAGNLTTSHLLVNTMLLLCRNPEQMQRVRADPSLIRALCEESLRTESPAQLIGRTARKDVEVGGVTIPAGAAILLLLASGNRDETRFEDPEDFVIERPDLAKRHMAFGYGAHTCVGAPLARLEGLISYRHLLSRLDNIELDEKKSDLTYENSKFRAPRKLHITFDRAR